MSIETKRNLIGGASITAVLTLFATIALWPVWSQGATETVARTVVLEARGIAFEDDNPTLQLQPGERIRFVVRNTDPGVVHSITLPGIDETVRHISWGEEIAFEVTIPDAGNFEYVCPQHAPKMRGRILIR